MSKLEVLTAAALTGEAFSEVVFRTHYGNVRIIELRGKKELVQGEGRKREIALTRIIRVEETRR